MNRVKTLLATAILVGSASSAMAAKPYNGNYTLSFFIDPGSNPGSSYCLALTQTGGVNGFTNSGTWTDTEGYGFSGNFLADGKSFHLVFVVSPFGDAVDLIGKAAKAPSGGFDDWFANSYLADSGTFTLVPGCDDARTVRKPTHSATY
jgi:hypothetical protein